MLSRPFWRHLKSWSSKSLMCQSVPTGYIPPGSPRGLAPKNCPEGRDLSVESCLGAGKSTRAGILWKMKVKLKKNNIVDQIQVNFGFHPGKAWGDSGKITIFGEIWYILNFCKWQKNPSMDNGLQQYIFMYVYIHCFNRISRLEYLKTFEWFCFSLKYEGFLKFSK